MSIQLLNIISELLAPWIASVSNCLCARGLTSLTPSYINLWDTELILSPLYWVLNQVSFCSSPAPIVHIIPECLAVVLHGWGKSDGEKLFLLYALVLGYWHLHMKVSDANFETYLTLIHSAMQVMHHSYLLLHSWVWLLRYLLSQGHLAIYGLVIFEFHNCSVTYLCTATGLSLWLVFRNINWFFKIKKEITTLRFWLDVSKSAIHLSLPLFTGAWCSCVSRSFSWVTNSWKARRASAGGSNYDSSTDIVLFNRAVIGRNKMKWDVLLN